jgi:hypothetical protein
VPRQVVHPAPLGQLPHGSVNPGVACNIYE